MDTKHLITNHKVSDETACTTTQPKKNSPKEVCTLFNTSCIKHQHTTSTSMPSVNRKKKHCKQCNKKLSIVSFSCRCGGHYCGNCRYAEIHDCTYNYKNDPVIVEGCVSRKIEKI